MRPQGSRLSSSAVVFARSNCFSATPPFMRWPSGSVLIAARSVAGNVRTDVTAAQRRRQARLVVAGPEAAGCPTSLWTWRRIVDLIRQHFQVIYPPIMSAQRPQPRAKERDDQRVREWIRVDWAKVKNCDVSARSSSASMKRGP